MVTSLNRTSPKRWHEYSVIDDAAPLETSTATSGTVGTVGTYVNSSTAAGTFQVPTPVAGDQKTIIQTTTSSALKVFAFGGTASTVGATGVTVGASATTLTFTAVAQAVRLMAISASRWEILYNTATVDAS